MIKSNRNLKFNRDNIALPRRGIKFSKVAIYIIAVIFGVLISCGCAATKKFEYPNAILPRVTDMPLANTVNIAKVEDERGNHYKYKTIMLYFIPLWPYGYLTDSRPEFNAAFFSLNGYDFQPERDLTRAMHISLRYSNLFRQVTDYTYTDAVNAEFVLRATLLKSEYKGTVLSYGISVAAPALWMLGAPVGIAENSIKIKFELFRGNNQSQPLWYFFYDGADDLTIGLYYHYGDDAKLYSVLVERAMNAALIDLYRHAQLHPELFK
jgi:hypothetical protein